MNTLIEPAHRMTSPSDATSMLRKRAAEFEGMLLSQILEKLKDAYQIPGEEEADSAGQSFQSFATSALGKGLAAKDGFGLSKLLVQSLTGTTKGSEEVKPGARTADDVSETARVLKLSHKLPIEIMTLEPRTL